jgi:predicted Zn-ribbon and HTH transcriptional regulator
MDKCEECGFDFFKNGLGSGAKKPKSEVNQLRKGT